MRETRWKWWVTHHGDMLVGVSASSAERARKHLAALLRCRPSQVKATATGEIVAAGILSLRRAEGREG